VECLWRYDFILEAPCDKVLREAFLSSASCNLEFSQNQKSSHAFNTRRFALVTPSARFHENDKPGPSFTAPPESPPNLPHLVHTYIYVYIDRFTDEPATPHPHPRPQRGYPIGGKRFSFRSILALASANKSTLRIDDKRTK